MNINNWSSKKKVLALLGMVLIIIGIVVTIFLVQRVQEGRSRASGSTTLSFDPPALSVAPGQDAQLSIRVDPGTNQINVVKLNIKFDPQVFSVTEQSFVLNDAIGFSITQGPKVEDGIFTVTLGAKNTTTDLIKTPQSLGMITFKALDDASIGESQISFETSETIVNSLGGSDNPSENVLSSATPATITVAAECKPNISKCSWDPVEGATSYDYVITNVDENKVFIEGNTTQTSVEFTSAVNVEYKCEVKAKNDCGGIGDSGTDSETCVPTSTPTPTNSPTPTLTSTPTPTEPDEELTSTPTPTEEEGGFEETPTPTTQRFATATPTTPEEQVNDSTPTPTTFVEATATPTLPPTGNPLVIGGIVGGILVLLGGLVLLIL